MSERVGHGVLTWDSQERRSDRYGAISLTAETFEGQPIVTERKLDVAALKGLEGQRVKVWVKVVESRESGHSGDDFLKVYPSQPEVGEIIELGVGVLALPMVPWNWQPAVALMPGDGREKFWMDPRALYRAHDQTVDLFVEETDADFHPVPDFTAAEAGAIASGDADGSFQVKGAMPTRVAPRFERLGDGMFIMGGRHEKGERVEILATEEDEPSRYQRLVKDD